MLGYVKTLRAHIAVPVPGAMSYRGNVPASVSD